METWEFDGAAWTKRTPPTSPSARTAHAMTTYGATALLFGGSSTPDSSTTGSLADTWEWNGTAWTKRAPTTSPGARLGSALGTRADRALLVGGVKGTNTFLDEVWEWNA
jgi:hypothetical protein